MNKKTLYLIILIVSLLLIVGLLLYFLGPQEKSLGPKINPKGLSQTETEQQKAGSVGEVMVKNPKTGKEQPLKTAKMPPAIFNAGGTITKLYANGFTMDTAGYSFADEKSRLVKVLYADKTVTTMVDRSSKYKGVEGLKHLKVGQKVLVESTENIRGKLIFKAHYINLLP